MKNLLLTIATFLTLNLSAQNMTPVTRADVNEINLRLDGLEKFGKQHRTGNHLMIAGTILSGLGSWMYINPIFTYYIPNAFTPTDDTKNETFFGKGTGYKTVTMQIFNRWGEKIYEETSLDPSWDGKLNGVDCQIDVYVYQFYVTDIFNETHLYRGRVSLIR